MDLPPESLRLLETPYVLKLFNPDLELEENPYITIEEGLERIRTGNVYKKYFDAKYWKSLSCGLHLECKNGDKPLPQNSKELTASIDKDLAKMGYFSSEPVLVDSQVLNNVRKTIYNLEKNGWPAVFAFVYDECWELLAHMCERVVCGKKF